MSKENNKKTKDKSKDKAKAKKQPLVTKHTKPDGSDEFYITKAPQKTLAGKIIIWILVALMGLASLGGLIIAFVQIANS